MTEQRQIQPASESKPLAGLRIGISANTSWNILNFRMPLIRRLIDDGAEVFVLSPPDATVNEITESGAIHLPITQLGRKGTNPIRDYQLMRELRRLYRDNRLDLVFQFTIKNVIYGCFAGRTLPTQTVSTITGLGYAFLNQGWMQKVASLLYRGSLKHCERVIFQNQDDRDLFVSRQLVDSGRTQIVRGSGVDTNRFSPVSKPESNELRFLFVGRLLKDKGVQELLEATKSIAETHPQIQFHFVGDIDHGNPASLTGADLEYWSSRANLVFHGFNHDVKQFVAESDVIILPSYREGLPRVLLEGMSMEKPCITTDVPGCHDTVDDDITGFVVKPKSAPAIQDAIIRMANLNSEQLKQMGQSGRKKVLESFSNEIVVNSYIKLLQDVLKTRNS